MKKIRFGITGSGYMGRTHAQAIKSLGDSAELVAIWGGSRAPALAEKYGAAYEPTMEGLMRRKDIDAVVISTPHHLHVQEVLLALENGKHALIEKPMATKVEDCDRMLAA
ncbi:MAG: Gfo/Idh/MocA family oxidoreductase, partial [Opitutus sp.]